MEPMYPHAPFLNQMLLSFVQLAEENILIFSLCLPKRSEKLGKETVPSSRLSFFFHFQGNFINGRAPCTWLVMLPKTLSSSLALHQIPVSFTE